MEKPIRILLVEDDTALCELLAMLFQDEGYEFQIHQDTADICSLVKIFNPTVVLLDYKLPSTTGGKLCLMLRADSETANIPVIIYSAISSVQLPVEKFNCNSFLEKPFDLEELIEVIERHTYVTVNS
ncbi:MAG: response regulator [Pedobacter sp.]|nr:MAG: response regulator [Pedobacter sp.]